MRDGFRDFGRPHAVVEREIEIERHLDHLVARNQRGDGDEAPVAGTQAWALPHLAEQPVLRVVVERRRGGLDARTADRLRWGHVIYLLSLKCRSEQSKRCEDRSETT